MSVSYIPEPAERPYYQGLFQAADTTGSGTLSGAEAVNFFMRSKLPMEVLKNIWTVADQPSTNSLDLKKFAVAVRLIQLTQNGQKGQGAMLAVAEGVTLRPVMFEGVSGVSVPMPPAGGPGGPSSQSPPPPQQQPQPQPQAPQAPPTPTQVRSPPRQQPQGMMQAPPSPARSVASSVNMPAMTPGGSRALVSQDPYFMTPSERARFDDLFPTYAKPDGYIYGKEAVELFMKSGVDQAVLRDIWSMVDRPVDNRLDRLEFAIAMHLIVCISKKNLPAPRGALPNSLKALKAASSTGAPPTPMTNPPVAQMAPMGQMGQMPPPDAASSTGPPKMAQPQMSMGPPSASFEQGPPPIVQTGGMNISDAFEGLSVTSNDVHAPTPAPAMPSSLPSYVPEETPMSFAQSGQRPRLDSPEPDAYGMAPPAPAPAPTPMAPPTPARVPEPVAAAPPPSSQALASKYDMGDAHQELDKLKAVMQKLQAENISLKAQLGTLSDEEKDVQKELSAVVTEIGKLSTELQSLRAQVSTAKSKLLEASAELKAAQERKTVLTDLIGEAKETKTAIDNASAAIANASVAPQPAAPPAINHFEGNLFGFDDAPVPAPAPVSMEPALAPMYSQPPPPAAQPAPAPMVQTVDSDDEDENEAKPSVDADASELFNNEYNPPAPAPVPEQPVAPPVAQQQPPPQSMYGAPPPQQQYQYQQPPPPAAQIPSAHPTPSAERPVAGKHRPNQPSMGFNSDFIMGGSADPLPQTSENGMARASRAASTGSDFGYDDEESFKKVEELKKKAESAAAAARDAEAAHSKLLNEAEELRVDADKQEATARSLKAAAGEKKSGRFGRGGGDKKKIMREAERAAEDAQDIRKRFLVIQGQAKDASAVAIQTRKEAEKLRKEAEQAEIDMVSAASLRDQQKAEQRGPPPQAGYGAPPQAPYGYGAPPPQGYGQPGAPPQYGQPMPPASDHGFSAGAMGGGGNYGFAAPPSQYGQQPAYGNPSPW